MQRVETKSTDKATSRWNAVGAKAQLTDAEEKTTEKGYEFHYRPSNVSLTELVDWVAAEGKCCPFFRFSHRPRT